MIIVCVNCNKKFNVNSELIPNEGRTIQCGSCNHVWFFKKTEQNTENLKKSFTNKEDFFKTKKEPQTKTSKQTKKTSIDKSSENTKYSKGSEIVKYQPKSNYTFAKFLSHILVLIISFVGLIIVLDTFKSSLYNIFPNLEFFLFSFYETLKDVELFIKDLI